MSRYPFTGLELKQIQGNLLRGYGKKLGNAWWIPLRVITDEGARDHLEQLSVTNADTDPLGLTATQNIAFTFEGLKAIGLPEKLLNCFPSEFVEGMGARAAILKDPDPSTWSEPWDLGPVHGMLSIYGSDEAAIKMKFDEFKSVASSLKSFRLLTEERCRRLETTDGAYTHEHFGFADGLIQPAVEGVTRKDDSRPKNRGFSETERFLLRPKTKWNPLKAGEFVLGYENLAEEIAPAPLDKDRLDNGDSWDQFFGFVRDGTYMVYRKLEQDVAAFRRDVARRAAERRVSDSELGARLMGRWRDGTPLALAPDLETYGRLNRMGLKDRQMHDFTFADDPNGERCPIGAHIRRANPRESLGVKGQTVRRHRILRRGIPYGPELAPDTIDHDGKSRGLAFVAINANIAGQFEVIQRDWLNDGDIFHLGRAVDVTTGTATYQEQRLIVVAGDPPEVITGFSPFVTLLGGGYFFVPSLAALQMLARQKYEPVFVLDGFDGRTPLVVTPGERKPWKLVEPLRYGSGTEVFEVPAGFETDFATIPALFRWLIPQAGRYARAYVLHDYLCATHLASPPHRDRLLRDALRSLGAPLLFRNHIWANVRVKRLIGQVRHREILTTDWLRILPLELAIWIWMGLMYFVVLATSTGLWGTEHIWRLFYLNDPPQSWLPPYPSFPPELWHRYAIVVASWGFVSAQIWFTSLWLGVAEYLTWVGLGLFGFATKLLAKLSLGIGFRKPRVQPGRWGQ